MKTQNTKYNSRKICSVPNCSTYGDLFNSLHKFPKDPKEVEKWKTILKIGKPITQYMHVCSKHFVDNDYFAGTSKRRRLKFRTLPSKNIPASSHRIKKTRSELLRRKPNKKENQQVDTNNQIESIGAEDEQYTLHSDGNEHDYVMSPDESFTTNTITIDHTHTALTHNLPYTTFEDKSTKTDFCDFFELPQILNTDEKLIHFTGVSYKIIDIYTNCTIQQARQNNVSEKNMKFWIILVLCKLKTNLSFACLAVLFGISDSTCSRMFNSVLGLLAISIKPAIYWPTKEEISKNMPKLFKNTRVVLDCMEVRLQRLKCFNCRTPSYPHYKKMHTIKFLIGTTPSGLISFISPTYAGNISDKLIFNKGNIMEKLDLDDAIIADKSILIEEECQSHFVKLIQAPNLGNKTQVLTEEATSSTEIARARVLIAKTIRKLKNFAVLDDKIDWYLIPYIGEIITVVAATVNMSHSMMANRKF